MGYFPNSAYKKRVRKPVFKKAECAEKQPFHLYSPYKGCNFADKNAIINTKDLTEVFTYGSDRNR